MPYVVINNMKKCFQDIAGFNDRWLIVFGLPVAAMTVSLLLFTDFYEQGRWDFLAYCIPMSFVYTGIFWFALRWIYGELKWRYPSPQQLWTRLAWVFVAFNLLHLAVNYSLDYFFMWLLPTHKADPSPVVEYIATILLSSLVITLYEAISFYVQLQRTVAEKVQLERQHVSSQLESLRNQVNPHFLFNSLNTLIYLIPEDPEKAVRFVQQLSKVYRYVLESRDERLIPLGEELEYLQSYVFLLKERFGDNLKVDIHGLENRREAAVAPLSLQMLFENAIKHNVISTEKPLLVEVFAENGHLVVRNNLQRKNQVMDSTGVGLDNIRARYRMLTDQEVEVIVSRDWFTVVLPLFAT